jgi:hypothetical protein
MIARVRVFPLGQPYSAVTDQPEEKHQAVNLFLQHISLICEEEMI